MKRFRWDKKYLYWGITASCVVAAAIVFYLLLNHLSGLREALRKFVRILSPFVWGLVIAYLLYPLQRIYQRHLFAPLAKALYRKSARADRAVPRLAKGLSIFFAEISLLVILAGLVWLVAPQLYSSVERIVVNSQTYVETVDRWVSRLLTNYPEIEAAVTSAVGDLSEGFVNLATKYLLPQMGSVITNVTSGVYSIARGIYNIIIGIIVSVYVLGSRELFAAHGKKLLYSVFSLDAAKRILGALHFTNDVFMGFLSGKILDSFIIAILCYIGCLIMKIPYSMLCSCIVGVTNIIPFFGPLFGMIPTTLIILMDDPIKAVIFLGFCILLQQFDGNFLGPKILSNSVGIGGFWVLFAIIVGAGLFGLPGMLLGVPVFVVIYTFFKHLVNRKLERSGLPVNTQEYVDMDHIDPETGEKVTIVREARRRHKKRKKTKAAPDGAASGDTGFWNGKEAFSGNDVGNTDAKTGGHAAETPAETAQR